MSSEIILYDLPSRGTKPGCWSLNPWKARASLNYKKLPYHTEWTEYPDLEPKFKDLGIPPNDMSTQKFTYSSPAVKFPDGKYVMESLRIARALDELQPEPPLFSNETETIGHVQETVAKIQENIMPVIVYRVPEMLLPERSAEYFRRTREKRFGMPLEDVAKSEKAKGAWDAAAPHIKELNEILTKEGGGPYVKGATVSFADFVIAGFWVFLTKVDQGDVSERMMKQYESFGKHREACQQWFERDD